MNRRTSPALVAVLALLGFLLVTAVLSADETKRSEEPRKQELVKLVEQRQRLVASLDRDVKDLRARVGNAQQRAARNSKLDQDQAERMARLADQAGTTALRGEGIEVRLADSDREAPSTEDEGAYQIHDGDIQLVVNALFAAGAEAVAVNDSRIVATTPIRSAGDTIVVNFRPLNPPYKVVAIGGRANEFEESEVAAHFRRWRKLFGLGFRVRSDRTVTVPAYTGRVDITSAVPNATGE